MTALTDQDREALTAWVFTFTEAEVISDPDFQAVERVVCEHVIQERVDLRARVTALPCETDNPNQNDVVEREYVLGLLDGGIA